jgi:hypothetical protein
MTTRAVARRARSSLTERRRAIDAALAASMGMHPTWCGAHVRVVVKATRICAVAHAMAVENRDDRSEKKKNESRYSFPPKRSKNNVIGSPHGYGQNGREPKRRQNESQKHDRSEIKY